MDLWLWNKVWEKFSSWIEQSECLLLYKNEQQDISGLQCRQGLNAENHQPRLKNRRALCGKRMAHIHDKLSSMASHIYNVGAASLSRISSLDRT